MYWIRLDLTVFTGSTQSNLTVGFEQIIVIHTLRITLLSDSGYALTGYEY
ncbi:hypothetical protein CBZ99_003987 [Salmonella enterica subsp. houtenae serovar 40:z4,z24:-]|nr:hypothetical protein [Salmonella enterica subsp. houtenae serovar 40:z4,z24:-]